MADLDFEAKYTSGGENEIGLLGDNFNRMSEKLASTISELKQELSVQREAGKSIESHCDMRYNVQRKSKI
mgnify:CR=1 FL=1